ncbi:MAG: ribosome silencing factor [Acidimicrobiales bacterium]
MTPVAQDSTHRWCEVAAQAASAKKGEDIVILDVGGVLAITDAFVIVSASNDRLVRSLAEEVEQQIKDAGGPAPLRIEGRREGQWVLMDYGDFVVHVFLDETRRFYDLERLWQDAPKVAWDDSRPAMAAGE